MRRRNFVGRAIRDPLIDAIRVTPRWGEDRIVQPRKFWYDVCQALVKREPVELPKTPTPAACPWAHVRG